MNQGLGKIFYDSSDAHISHTPYQCLPHNLLRQGKEGGDLQILTMHQMTFSHGPGQLRIFSKIELLFESATKSLKYYDHPG